MRLRNITNTIQSRQSKRQELQHIEKMIEGKSILPDFGFNQTMIEWPEQYKGWDLLIDFIQESHKYERIRNFISVRQKMKLEQQKIAQMQQKQSKALQ